MISGQNISLIFTAVFILLALIGLVKGFSRGLGRQTVRTVTIAVSIIAAVIATTAITRTMATLCQGKTLDEVLMALGLYDMVSPEIHDMLACYDAITAERLIELPLASIIMPFIFTSSFVTVSAILLIVHAIFCAIFKLSGKHAGVGSKLLGMVVGAVQGFAVAIIFMLPIMNIIGIASSTNAQIIEHHEGDVDEVQFCQIYNEYIDPIEKSPVFAIAYNAGGNLICDSFATINIDGKDINLRDTTAFLAVAADDFMELGGFDWSNPTPEQCDALEQIVDKLAHDTYVASILSGVLRGTATAIDRGVIVFQLEEPILGVMNNLVSIFTTLNEDNFERDVDTILDVYLLLAREGILTTIANGSTEDITAAFTQENEDGETAIRRIINTIQSNQHMKPLVTMLTKLSLSIMMNNVGVENGAEIYDSVKEGISGVIAISKDDYENEEEYKTAISESLNETLINHEIELAPEIVDNMAQYVADNFSDLSEASDDEVNDTILSYYEAYMKYINEGGDNPFPGLLPDDEGGEGGGLEDLLPEGGDLSDLFPEDETSK